MGLADEILDTAGRKGSKSKLARWLDQNPEPAKVFWEVVERGYVKDGRDFAPLYGKFCDHFPECPRLKGQSAKVWVDGELKRRS